MKVRYHSLCLAVCVALVATGAVPPVQAQPDLVVTSVSGPKQAYLGETVSVTCQVRNQGDTESGPYEVIFYLSKDETIDPSTDQFVKKRAFSKGLPAGATKKTTTEVTIPNPYLDGLSGSYFYGAAVQSGVKASTGQVAILRYKGNGDGTVTDFKTGLMWQKRTNLTPKTWSKAIRYCEGLTLAGYEDWRVPRIEELVTLIDYSQIIPAIDPIFESQLSPYSSSTTIVNAPDYAWYVYFYDGEVTILEKNRAEYTRCVRRGP